MTSKTTQNNNSTKKAQNVNYTKNIEDVIKAERLHINNADHSQTKNLERDYYALAFSGGGIRSASFCMGIMQALVEGNRLSKIDYLSTASGGGYIGSALTWFLSQPIRDGQMSGTESKNFPLGKRVRFGAQSHEKVNQNTCDVSDLTARKCSNNALKFIRQHGKYLTPSEELNFTAFAGYVLRSSLISFVVYFSIMTLIMLFIQTFDYLFQKVSMPDIIHADGTPIVLNNVFFLAAIVFLCFFLITGVIYSLLTRISFGTDGWRYQSRIYNQMIIAVLLKLLFISLILASLPVLYEYLKIFSSHIQAAGASTAFGTVMGWYMYYKQSRSTEDTESKGSDIKSIIATCLILYGMLFGAYILAAILMELNAEQFLISVIVLSAIAFLMGYCTNINYAGAHRLYRDRLMETFMPDRSQVETNTWGLSVQANKGLIENMCKPPNCRPYHLVNTNLVLANSPTAKFRGRGGDSFILSPLYCGSDATGWRTSSSYMKKGARGMTLATAMAISGASLNPNAANSGRGATRNKWVSILYTLLNLRLGYWAQHPKEDRLPRLTPNFIRPGLTQSIVGNGLHEATKIVELSDGGHFDNTAIYELIRRRVKVIVLCDGGADEAFSFDDLGNAIERVRVDFGVSIKFNDPDWDLRWVVPGSGELPIDSHLQYKPAKRGFAIATIDYKDQCQYKGTLIYIKSTLTPGLSPDLYSYKAANPSFPHQPTVDQFFDEVQFEAYRELGYYLGWQMLEANANVGPGESTEGINATRWL